MSWSRAFVGVAIWSVLWTGCSKSNPLQGKLEEAIRSAASSGQVFRIEDSTDFAWDELYVIGPYAGEEDIPKDLGSVRPAGVFFSSGEESLLVFVRERKVVTSFYLHPSKGSFAPNPIEVFTREKARFFVETGPTGFSLRPN